jgi:hypothetical protein
VVLRDADPQSWPTAQVKGKTLHLSKELKLSAKMLK